MSEISDSKSNCNNNTRLFKKIDDDINKYQNDNNDSDLNSFCNYNKNCKINDNYHVKFEET